MKQIELTEEHKSKLLEMCKTLFPNIIWQHYDIANESEDNLYPEIWIIQNNSEIYPTYIHWFEFCMTHLAEKIIATYEVNVHNQRVYKRTLNDDLSKFYLEALDFSRGYNKTHPVNYLYSEFKKL